MSLCFVPPFFRKKRSKKSSKSNNVYNVEEGKIVDDSTEKLADNTYVKYEKYRPSIQEERMNLATNADNSKLNRSYPKLPNNLSKNLTKQQTSFDFIDQLEENSKKIENIFSKCKTTSSSNGNYEHIENAFRMLLLNDVECDMSKIMLDVDRRKLQENISKSLSSHKFVDPQDYENIKKALQIMFGDRNFTKAPNETPNRSATAKDEKKMVNDAKSTVDERRMANDAKLQSLVDNVFGKHLRGESKTKNSTTSHLTSLTENCSSNDDNRLVSQSTDNIDSLDSRVHSSLEKDDDIVSADENHIKKKKRLKKHLPKRAQLLKSSSSEAEIEDRVNRNRRHTVSFFFVLKYQKFSFKFILKVRKIAISSLTRE